MKEHDIVELTKAHEYEGVTFPKGTKGTIVSLFTVQDELCDAALIEIPTVPHPTVLGAYLSDLRPVS